jgi:hypothetical protein
VRDASLVLFRLRRPFFEVAQQGEATLADAAATEEDRQGQKMLSATRMPHSTTWKSGWSRATTWEMPRDRLIEMPKRVAPIGACL